MLIHRQMNSTERAPTDLLLDDILIDPMLPLSVVRATGVLRASIERFLEKSISTFEAWVFRDVSISYRRVHHLEFSVP